MTGGRAALPVVLSHDYLTQRGGAERVVLAMLDALPSAPVHCALYDPQGTYPEFGRYDIRPLAIDRLAPLRRNHRLSLPLMAPAFRSRKVDAPVVLCSSSGWSHGIRTDGRKVVYCHSPARWLYRPDGYLRHFGLAARAGLGAARRVLVAWDREAMMSADRIVVNSSTIAAEVERVYGLQSVVVPPASTLSPDGAHRPSSELEPGFWLVVSRLLGYKRLDVLLEVARRRPGDCFALVGDGPHAKQLMVGSPANVVWLGGVGDDRLRWLYANCIALVGTSEEDFGLTPVEAAAFGAPSIVPRARGYLDHVVDGSTGVFHDGTPDGLDRALSIVATEQWDKSELEAHAARYHPALFADRMLEVVESVL